MRTTTALLLAVTLVAAPAAAQQRVELPARDRPLQLDARTLFTLGAVDGADHENFGLVTDVAFDARGSVYVLDAQAYRITVFDSTGAFVRTIGRQGGGPGEFTFPTGLAVLPSGELVVNDAGRGTLQVFAGDGAFVRSVTVDEDLGRVLGRLRATQGGTLISETAQLGQGMRRPAEGGRFTMPPRSITALSVDDVARGTRLFNAAPRELAVTSQRSGEGARFTMALSAFEPQLLWTPTGDGGIAASNQAGYRITLADARGRPTHYLERAIEPRAVTAADRKRWLAQREAGGAGRGMAVVMSTGGGAPAAGVARPPSALTVDAGTTSEKDVNWGPVIPVVNALGTDSFGRLWVQRSDADLGDGPIDIIDSGLRYLGTLAEQEMPRAFGPGGRIAYIVRDDLDVQRVVIRQVTR